MSSDHDHDPPRLRSVKHELPARLSDALETLPGEEPSAQELQALARSVHLARAREPRESLPPRRRLGVRSASRRALSLALTFAAGAGAGVGVTTVVFLVSRASAPPPAASARAVRSAPLVPSATVEPFPSSQAPVAPLPPSPAAPHPKPVPRPSDSEHDGAAAAEAQPTPDELALVARAQAALARTPGAALSIVAEHERAFPHGALTQEREVVAIDALLRLNRRAEAEARAARFHQRFPGSAHGRRVDVLLEVRN